MDIGLTIRKIRQGKGIKQEELANFLKISQSHLSKIESGTTFITFEQVINIANYLKTSLFEFLPQDLVQLQQLDFRMQLEELHQEIKMHKDTISTLLKTIRNLESEVLSNKTID